MKTAFSVRECQWQGY